MDTIAPSTIDAYLETDYRVFAPLPFVLRVGVANAALAALYRQYKADSGAFITACNPFSQISDDAVNSARQMELATDLKLRSLHYIDGAGVHMSGSWPEEPSFLVLGLALEAAKVLGKKYDQNAIVWCGADCTPELILLR